MRNSMLSVAAAIRHSGATLAYAKGLRMFYGSPGDGRSYGRVITITPAAKSVNVSSGESVKFADAASGQSFVWRFDTPTWTEFDLAVVAPVGALENRHLKICVEQSPDEIDD